MASSSSSTPASKPPSSLTAIRTKFTSIFTTPLKETNAPAPTSNPSDEKRKPPLSETPSTNSVGSRKRPRVQRSPRSPQAARPSPLIKRIPSMLRANEEYIPMSSETSSRGHRESTPRSKRLRRTSDNYSTSTTTTTAITTTSSGGGVGTSFDSINRNSNTNYINSNNIKKTFSRESSAHPFHTSTSTNSSTNSNTRAMSFAPDAREPSTTPMDTTMTSVDDDPEELDDLINKYNFSLQEALLFLRIRNRGYEPLMPAHWQVDFGTMPDSLFFNAEVANEVGHIDSITLDGTFSATNAFRGLVALGAIVRGKMEAKKDPEDRVLAAVRKYVRWSVEDVKKHLNSDIYPRLVLVGSYGKGAVHCENKMQRKLHDLRTSVLAEAAHLRDAPLAPSAAPTTPQTTSSTIYGIAVAGPVVALVTMHCVPDPNQSHSHHHSHSQQYPYYSHSHSRHQQPPQTPGNPSAGGPAKTVNTIKTMATLDFSDSRMDFWNAVAVALLVIAAREDELERAEFYKGHDVKVFDINGGMAALEVDEVRRGWEKTPMKKSTGGRWSLTPRQAAGLAGLGGIVGGAGFGGFGGAGEEDDDPDA